MSTIQTDFKIYHKNASAKIKKELDIFSDNLTHTVQQHFSPLEKLNLKFTDSFYSGKMIRGTLVKFGYELVNNTDVDTIIKPAAAFEILHSSLLIHDDIIDKSILRRGKPTVHMDVKDEHYGISQAICLGDLGITLSINLLSESNFPTEIKNRAIGYFSHIISTTILGQMLDVQASLVFKRSEEQVMNIYQTKTAQYTIVAPLTMGAMLGGATDEVLEKIKLFGEQLGVAFQIQDDILGVFGDETTIGKSTTSDIKENKSTLLFTYSLQHANAAQGVILKKYYGKKISTKKHHEMIKKVFTDTGALEYNQKKFLELALQAKKIIPEITKDNNKQMLLTQFVDLLVSRKK
jgi:geranylgeranyl diphosphate synthase type I